MILRNAVLASALLASGISFALAEQPAPTLEMSADGEIQIAVDGHVSDYRLQSKLVPIVGGLVDRGVRGWRFEPVVVDGVPVVAKTAMHIQLKAEPASGKDNYTLRIVDVRFGEPKRTSGIKPPRYPLEAITAHAGAKVILAIRLDETGRVVEAQPYQTSLDVRTRSESEAEHYRHIFEKASVDAANGWRYDLSETINGKPIGTNAIVPVVYSLCEMPCSRHNAESRWKAYLPGPVHLVPWMHEGHLADNQDLSTLEDGQVLSLDSRFRLKDNVIGKTL